MAKRASLTFDQVKASKAPSPEPENTGPIQGPKRGRPPKVDRSEQVFGMTLRIPAKLRRALREAADQETDQQGRVVSVHDIVVGAVLEELRRRGIPTG